MNKINVIIVDDHALFRRGVADVIYQSEHFSVHKEYACGLDFLAEQPHEKIDLLLLDMQMPNISGLQVLKKLRESGSTIKVIILTASIEEDIILEVIRHGANGFLPKDTLPEEIISQLEQVMQGKMVLHPEGVGLLAAQFRLQSPSVSAVPSQIIELKADAIHQQLFTEMTQREQETLILIAKGLNNKLIARELGISDGTVKVYVKNLLRKLNMHSRLELSIWVHQKLNGSQFNLPH